MTAYQWEGRWIATRDAAAGFDCADSWRHVYGRAHGLELHRLRFAAGAGPLPDGLWESALALLDTTADLFPRISVLNGAFRFDIRPAPPVRATTTLTLTDAPDPRTTPLIKGPDLERLAEHKRMYATAGTDDVIVGHFAETTTGALVGWTGDRLVVPEATHLPSTTLALVVARARTLGIHVDHRTLNPNEPMWFLNALHGVSPVRRIVAPNREFTPPHHPGEDDWQHWWLTGHNPEENY